MQKELKLTLISLGVLLLSITPLFPLQPGDVGRKSYYVDKNHANASDAREKSYNSILQPWQTIGRATDLVEPGDTVYVREGVYHEAVRMQTPGTREQVITFIAFPGEKVVVDGSFPLTGWESCSSAEECGGNPHWRNIYYIDIPDSVTATSANLYENEIMLQVAQEPDPVQPIYFETRSDEWFTIPEEYYPLYNDGTVDGIVNPLHFNQTAGDYWNNAYLLVHTANNDTFLRKINQYDPGESAIGFKEINVAAEYNGNMAQTLLEYGRV